MTSAAQTPPSRGKFGTGTAGVSGPGSVERPPAPRFLKLILKRLVRNRIECFQLLGCRSCVKKHRRHKMWTNTTRGQYRRKSLRYAGDMTDAEWAMIEVVYGGGSGWGGHAKWLYGRLSRACFTSCGRPASGVCCRMISQTARRCSVTSMRGGRMGCGN
jgi:hypothetical protein